MNTREEIEAMVAALESEESNLSDGFSFYVAEWAGDKKLSYDEGLRVVAGRVLAKWKEKMGRTPPEGAGA